MANNNTSESPKKPGAKIENFSDFIHPRNPYKKYDYDSLAKSFLEFKSYLTQAPSVDPKKPPKFFLNWSDRDAVRCLMRCCLKRDFQLDLEMPEGCLAPSLALKMNYLLWIEDTAQLNGIKNTSGVDVGTGGGIYFCSMASRKFGWKMVGTETNSDDFGIAEKNIVNNKLAETVKVIHNLDKNKIFPPEIFESGNNFFFSLCNPPFFEIAEARRERDVFSEKDAGRDHEMTTSGGEVEFIIRMIEESILCQNQISLFTTMIGQKKSLGKLLDKLTRVDGVKRWVVNQFCQGKTMRWCLAWTFKDSLQLKASAPVSEARHQKKVLTPIRFLIESLPDKTKFGPMDVFMWFLPLITSLGLEIMSEEKDSEDIFVEFRSFVTGWRGQRAKRRKEKQSQRDSTSEQDSSGPESKRAKTDPAADLGSPPKVDEQPKSESDSSKVDPEPVEAPKKEVVPIEPVVIGKIHIHEIEAGQVVFDLAFKGGTLGKNAIAELSQFFKSRLKTATTGRFY